MRIGNLVSSMLAQRLAEAAAARPPAAGRSPADTMERISKLADLYSEILGGGRSTGGGPGVGQSAGPLASQVAANRLAAHLGGRSADVSTSGQATLFRHEVDLQQGGLFFKGHTSLLGAQGRLYAGWDPNTRTLRLGAGGGLTLVDSHYEFGYQKQVDLLGQKVDVHARGQVDATVGAEGQVDAEISLGREPRIEIGGEAFAGASASVEGEAGIGGLGSVEGGAEAWAGVGVSGDAGIGFEDGKLSVDFSFGLALGIGGQVDFGFDIDLAAIKNRLLDIASRFLEGPGELGSLFAKAGKFLGGKLLDGVGGALGAIGGKLKGAAGEVGGLLKDTVSHVGGFVEDVGKGVGSAAKAVGGAVAKVFSGW